MKKGENKSGLNSLFRHLQGTSNCNAQPPQSKSFSRHPGQDRVSGLQMAILGQSGGISLGSSGTSQILRASTEGGVSSPNTSSEDIKTPRKQKICEKAKLIWPGLYKLAKAIEPIVPEPFNTPFKIFNAISDVVQKCFDNEEELKAMMERFSSRLVEANCVLLWSDDYGIDVAESSMKLAELVVSEALKIHNIQHSSRTEKILGQDNIAQQINKYLGRLNQGMEEHHTSQLSYAPNVLFNAAGKAGMLLRRACTLNTHENLLDRLEAWALDPDVRMEDPSAGPMQLISAYKPLVDIFHDVQLHLLDPVPNDHIEELLAPLVIVINALDEIEDEDNHGTEFIKEFTSSLSKMPLPRFCLEEIKPSEATEDIRHFLHHEFAHLGKEELKPIVEKSAGIFIYAAMVVQHLHPPGVPLTAGEQKTRLKRLLAGGFGKGITADELLVDSLYKAVTQEALRNPGPEVKTPRRADEAAVNDNFDKVQKSLDSLYAVLYVSECDNCVYACHKSFDDFILSRSQLAQSATTYFPDRTWEYFDILNKSLHFNICDLKSSYLFDKEDAGLHE
ncbi:hypothetical protein C8R44DRAFT_742834 [Mycena epipterygia]|nr:hypothetical protein C8R44DRAFT_742834 [Mycena epipterygia]